jgi:hypothetical protein
MATKSSASIIMLDPTKPRHEQEPFIISINDINTDGHSNAFDGEFSAIDVTNYINIRFGSKWNIKSDCKSTFDLINDTMAGKKDTYNRDNYHYLNQCLRHGIAPGTTIAHVKGHPEKRKPGWAIEDFGNFMADLAAKED